MSIEPWGNLASGEPAHLYRLDNGRGLAMEVSDYGGIITKLEFRGSDVVLGCKDFAGYLENKAYFGCVIGRYGNRIRRGFAIGGRQFDLAKNNEPNGHPCHLHGGVSGFDKRVWQAFALAESALLLTLTSPHGDQGYPGALRVKMLYQLTPKNGLRIDYWATSDADTHVNLTNHSYFNFGSSTILDHRLRVNADAITPTDEGMIPTGELMSVAGSPFDFRETHVIGERIDQYNEQLKFGGGYDHNWALAKRPNRFGYAATLSGGDIAIDVLTSEPGIQVYTGNFLDGTIDGKGDKEVAYRSGVCLETQHFPDSPNKPGFPSTLLRAGKVFRSATEYRFRG